MIAELRPMGLGEILDRMFAIYRGRFWVFAGIGAVPVLMMMALHLADSYWWHLGTQIKPFKQPGIFLWGALVSLAYYHVAILVHSVFTPAIVQQSSEMIFGEARPMGNSLRYALRRWRRFLWIGVLFLGVVLIGPEVVAGGLLFGMGTAMDAMGLLHDGATAAFMLLLLLPLTTGVTLYLWMTGCCAFLVPACACEDARSFKALRRSWTLSRDARWRVAVTWLLVFLLSWAVLAGVQMLFRQAVVLSYQTLPRIFHFWYWVYVPSTYAIQTVLSVVLGPLYPIAVTIFYYDQRIRKEGFDIEWMMKSAGLVESVAAVPAGELGA
ncbi:MAG TPA: hypothetical protein VG225_07180 [Terracidiphilus sp.]|jgi:hypothetical protein|nr:hypothetical protein [Terracidiphilus sp.]